jgi:ABC-type lipopolysaccharide export system ATPase subunit
VTKALRRLAESAFRLGSLAEGDDSVEDLGLGTGVADGAAVAQAALSLANYGYVVEVGKIVLQNTGQALFVDENVRKVYLGED